MKAFRKNKKLVLSLLSMLLLNSFYELKAQGNLDSISPDHSVTFTTSAQYPWTATRTNNKWVANSGNRGAHSTSSSLYATVVVPQGAVDGNLSFTYRVSSQTTYDVLYVYVDNVPLDDFTSGKSGTIPETDVDIPLSVGTHTIEWVYQKNASTNTGEDAVFVSNVKLGIGYCIRPDSIILNDVTDTTAYISWIGGSETNIEYGPLGFERGNGMADYVTDTFYTITQLQPNTYYTVYLQTFCNNGDTSVWVSYTFRTACAAITTLPYTQDFDSWTASSSTTSTIDPCWSRKTNYTNSTMYPYVNTSYSHSGTKSMYFYGGSSNNPYSLLVLPSFADTLNTLQVSFWMLVTSTTYRLEVGVMSNPDDISTFTPISTVNCTSTGVWTLKEVPLTYYTGQGRYIAFRTPGTTYTYCYIDDVTVEKIPTCRRPYNVSARNITTNSATIYWNAANTSSYTVEYGYPGFPLGSGTRIQCNSTSQVINGLSPASSYEVYVTSRCTNGETNISTPYIFHTSCGKIQSVPFVETFEGLTTGAVSSKLPCWKTGSNYSTSYPSINNYLGSNAVYMYSYRSSTTLSDVYCYLATPPIDTNLLPLRSLEVSFKIARSNNSYRHEVAFGVMTDSSDITTFDTLDIIYLNNYGIWTDYTYNMSNYRGDGRFFAIKSSVYGSQSYSYPYIDDIVIDHINTCPDPTDLRIISAYDPDDVQITWTSWPAPATSWDIIYGPRGFSPYLDGIRINGVTDTIYSISGLSVDTTYDIYVRSQCPIDSSAWISTPISVTPGTVVMPVQGTQTLYLCDAMIYDNGGEYGNYFDNNNGTIIIYPTTTDSLISLTGTYATETTHDVITVYDGVGNSGTILASVSGVGNLSCTSTTGPLTLVFSTDIGTTMSGFALRARCVAPPSCRRPIPTVLNVESRQVTIDVISSPANNWIMEFKTSNFIPGQGQGTTITRGSALFTLSGLQPQQTYYAYIRTACGGNDTSQWSNMFKFTTPCDPITSLPVIEDFDAMNVGMCRNCWVHSSSYPQTRAWYTSTNNKAYYFSDRVGVNNYVAIQKISNIPISDLHVKFSLFGLDTNTIFSIGVMTNPNDYTTFIPVSSFHVQDEYNWYNYDIPLSSYSNNAGYIAFSARNTEADLKLYFDNLFIDTTPTCAAPIPDSIIVSQTDATLFFNSHGASQFIMKYGHKGFNHTNTSAYIFFTPEINIPGLQPNSEYDVYVRAVCGPNDTSDWSLNPIQITTTCEQRTLPYTEEFDRYHGTPYSKYTRSMPTCWNIVSSVAPLSQYRPQLCHDIATAVSGEYSLMLNAPATVSTSPIGARLDTVEAEFLMRVDSLTTGVIVGVIENPTDNSTFVAIDTVFNTVTDVYQLQDVVFNTYNGSAHNLAFRNYSRQNDDTMRVFLDNLVIRPVDLCIRPNNIVVSDITAHTARVSWNERGNATSWILEYDTLGYTLGTGTQITVNTNSYVITGLDSNRAYSVNVRSICTDTSEWATHSAEFILPRCDESCAYTLAMSSTTTGWYGGYVEVKYDERTTKIYTLTTREDKKTIIACPDEIVAFTWIPGQNDAYCHFVILRDDDTLYASKGTPVSGLFYTTTCGSDTACPQPNNLTINIIDYQTVEASWHGTGTFEIACKKEGDAQEMFKDTIVTPNYVNSYRIDSLNPDTNYVFMIRKLCYTDSISSWQIYRFKIADVICVVPINLRKNLITNNSGAVQWESFANNISWGVRCFTTVYNFDTIIYTNNNYQTIDNLQSGIRYYVTVMGLCSDSMTSIWSDTIDFVTKVCDTVYNVVVSSITDTSAVVSWTPGNTLSRWDVDYGTKGFPVGYGTIKPTTSPRYTISGLQPGTSYDVYVRSSCGTDYYSMWSMKVTFSTTGTSIITDAETNDVSLKIIPNPATKTTAISVQGINGKAILTITDISGKTIYDDSFNCNGTLEKSVDVSRFAKGTYFVHVANETVNVVQKLIVQ